MDLPTNQEIRTFYRVWLKKEYGMEMDHLPSPALSTIVEFTKAVLEKYGAIPLPAIEDVPFMDGMDSL